MFFNFVSSLGLRLILKAVVGILCFVANFGENYPRGLREAKMSDAVELGARPPGSFHIAGCSNCPLLSAGGHYLLPSCIHSLQLDWHLTVLVPTPHDRPHYPPPVARSRATKASQLDTLPCTVQCGATFWSSVELNAWYLVQGRRLEPKSVQFARPLRGLPPSRSWRKRATLRSVHPTATVASTAVLCFTQRVANVGQMRPWLPRRPACCSPKCFR